MNWEELFELGFKESKKSIEERYRLEEDDSGDPRRVAVRKIAERIPFPVKVLELEIDLDRYDHIQNKICPMCYYDISRYNSNEVKNLGRVSPTDSEFVKILKKEFNMNHAEEFVKDFTKKMDITGTYSSDLKENMQFFFYDPREDTDKFNWDFVQMMERSIVSVLAYNLKTEPDYNQEYKMNPEQIVGEKELLKKHTITGFGSSTDFQQDMTEIQLIPQVNEHVKKTIERAKKLYIFGGYVYDFFIVAQHYSVMALEAAMKHRYFEHFPDTVEIKNKHKTTTVSNADYSRIMDICNYKEGWNFHSIFVNNERFLHSPKDLLKWLVDQKIIILWDQKKCEYKMENRNYLSHPTYAPTHAPGEAYNSIKESVFYINKMFSSIKNNN